MERQKQIQMIYYIPQIFFYLEVYIKAVMTILNFFNSDIPFERVVLSIDNIKIFPIS